MDIKKIFGVFGLMFKWIESIFTDPAKKKKAQEIATKISNLSLFLLPAVKLVTDATQNKVDDMVLEAAQDLGFDLGGILNEQNDEVRRGLMLSLAAKVGEKYIGSKLDGKHVFVIGEKIVKTIADLKDIHNDIFRSAAQSGLTITKHSEK